jgi:hypothetical protein
MSGERHGREIAGTSRTDVTAPARSHSVTVVPASANANLGTFMRISGETEAAETLLRETMAREPDNAAADDRRGAETVHDASASAAGISP